MMTPACRQAGKSRKVLIQTMVALFKTGISLKAGTHF